MKKKFAVMLLALCAVTVFAFGLAACDLIGGDHGGTAHTHNYVLKYDETYHWQECTVSGCTAKTIDRTVHSFDGDICKGCGYKKGEPPGEECEHVYDKYEPLNDEQHNVYCGKCGDRKIENHNVSGEFGICVCGWHNHIPSEKWETSDYYHWHNCTVSGCHERLDYGMHDRTDGSCVCERNGEVFKFTLNDDGESYCFELVYEKTLTEVIIPAEYSGKPVTSIGRDAFKNCNSLKSVTVPNSVTSIWVLRSCDSLESIYYEGDIAEW